MGTLKDKRIVVSGGSRGIGLEIAKLAAKDGAKVAIMAKTAEPHPKLPGTIFTAAKEIEACGGEALPIQMDVRHDPEVEAAVSHVIGEWGGIDIVLNNASAIQLTTTEQTDMKKYRLMMEVNAMGTFALTRACLPSLKQGDNPHILTLSPPIDLNPKWLGPHVAYTGSKYLMSLFTMGWAAEFKRYGIAANCLWPMTLIDTAAVQMLQQVSKQPLVAGSRKPEIVAKAAYAILTRDAATCTGNCFLDEEVLRQEGETDFDQYATTPGTEPIKDLFVE